MVGVELFLLGLVLDELEAIWVRMYLLSLGAKVSQRLYVDGFNFNTYGITIGGKCHDSIVILKGAYLEFACSKLCWGVGRGIEHFRADVKFAGGVEHHFAQLPPA